MHVVDTLKSTDVVSNCFLVRFFIPLYRMGLTIVTTIWQQERSQLLRRRQQALRRAVRSRAEFPMSSVKHTDWIPRGTHRWSKARKCTSYHISHCLSNEECEPACCLSYTRWSVASIDSGWSTSRSALCIDTYLHIGTASKCHSSIGTCWEIRWLQNCPIRLFVRERSLEACSFSSVLYVFRFLPEVSCPL